MEKYWNDAIIGNKNIRASYSKKGELLRFMYPNPDARQFIKEFEVGLKVNDSGLIKLHDDINNVYRQYYTEDTNILNTEIKNTYFNIQVHQLDFIPMKENVLIKRYEFSNQNNIDLDVKVLIRSKLLTDQNEMVGAKVIDEGMIQYTHHYQLSTFSKNVPLYSQQINDVENNIYSGVIQDKDYIGMSNDSAICYDLGVLKPGEKKVLPIFVLVEETNNKSKMSQMEDEIIRIQKIDIKKQYQLTKSYWRRYVTEHSKLDIKVENAYDEKVLQIYHRTILLFPLLQNEQTGGIAAAVEVDEERAYCGRYAYCWPRDAVFITKALDILNMKKETEKFYKSFCKNTQSKNGMWEQRFYTDGRLAPCWGYQIDETASVVYGIFAHYEYTKDLKFLKDNLKMMENGTKFLEKYVEDLLQKTHKMHVSYDIWEMHEGIHLYSLASIYAAFDAMLKTHELVKEEFKNNRLKLEQIAKQKERLEPYMLSLKEYVITNLYDTEKKSFVRNTEDKKMDVSMIGAVVPFNLFSAKEKKVTNTVERINLTLRTYTGAYKRFEQDQYRQGNPWVITTLWMALYYIENKQIKEAKECLDIVVKTSTEHGFLAEQIDNENMQSTWVIGLGWSHAMFILVLEKLMSR